jgi:hypothetical protein
MHENDGSLARLTPIWPDHAPMARLRAGVGDAFAEATFRRLLGVDSG